MDKLQAHARVYKENELEIEETTPTEITLWKKVQV